VFFDYIFNRDFTNWSFYVLAGSFSICLIFRYILVHRFVSTGLKLETKVGDKFKNLRNKEYKKAKLNFSCDYQRLNPLTSAEKTREYLQYLQSILHR